MSHPTARTYFVLIKFINESNKSSTFSNIIHLHLRNVIEDKSMEVGTKSHVIRSTESFSTKIMEIEHTNAPKHKKRIDMEY